MLCNNQIHHTYITYITNRNVSQIIAYLPCVMPSDSVCFIRFCFMEQAMAPHSSTLAWKLPWTEGPGRLKSMGSRRVGHDWATSLSLSCIGEGNGNPLQRSCLENPREEGAWWAAVYGVAQSQTWLKWLSSSSSSNSLLRSRDITLPTKVHLVKAMVFPVVTCGWIGP